MPAPVTTTMRLLFATESERFASVRRETGSDDDSARSSVVIMGRNVVGLKKRRRGVDKGLNEGLNQMSPNRVG